MGILDLLRPQPKEEKRILKPLDEGLKERLDNYIDQNYGTPYITQDEKEKAAEKARSEGPRKQKDRTKSIAKDVKDDGNTAAEVNKEKPQPVSDRVSAYLELIDDSSKLLFLSSIAVTDNEDLFDLMTDILNDDLLEILQQSNLTDILITGNKDG